MNNYPEKNRSQWLQQQNIMKAPSDDFDAIYRRVKPKTGLRPFALAASMGLLALLLWSYYQPTATENNYINQLQSQISLMEHNLDKSNKPTPLIKSTAEFENQLMINRWLSHINNQLNQNPDQQKTQRLLQAKWALLNDLKKSSDQPQLI